MALEPPPEEIEEGSEPWMGSFADMMSLLLGFFMILYSMSHMDDKKFYEFGKSIASSFIKQDKTKEEVEIIDDKITLQQKQVRAFQMLVAILNLGDPDSAVRKVAKAYEDYLNEESAKKLVKEKIDPRQKVEKHFETQDKKNSERMSTIVIPVKKIFKTDSTDLIQGAEAELLDIGSILSSAKDFINVRIVVHSSSHPPPLSSGFKDNMELTTNQALTIAHFFRDAGIPGEMLYALGRGSYNPWVPEYTESGELIITNQEENERIEIILEKKAKKE